MVFFPGEDRWLCTLLLQQGYRVEYCAASDSFTFAPEGFDEFFNQRRRWMPSTMANVLDLLLSWKHTTTINENISFLYIVYQTALLVASLIGPGTIFLMIIGAVDVALDVENKDLKLVLTLVLNFIPVFIFIYLCYATSTDVQVRNLMEPNQSMSNSLTAVAGLEPGPPTPRQLDHTATLTANLPS